MQLTGARGCVAPTAPAIGRRGAFPPPLSARQPAACHRTRQQLVCAAASSSGHGSSTAEFPVGLPTPVGKEVETKTPGVLEGTWAWRGYKIRYQRCGDAGPPVLCIHGFGGNCNHWRKNLPVLGQTCRAFAIDLLGYGYSDKPDPRQQPPNALYNFETWGQQALDFVREVVGQPSVMICNSVGGLVGLQAAALDPSLVRAVQVQNISLRMLHASKQSWLQRLFIARLQRLLRETNIGTAFFGALAKPRAVRSVLRECYGDKAAVTDELVQAILQPGLQPGAAQVFLDFISYSGGPLPEDLVADSPVPVSVLWGAKDPWEKVEWGRRFEAYATVEEYVELPGAGHCIMDEAPERVNPLMLAFIERHAAAL